MSTTQQSYPENTVRAALSFFAKHLLPTVESPNPHGSTQFLSQLKAYLTQEGGLSMSEAQTLAMAAYDYAKKQGFITVDEAEKVFAGGSYKKVDAFLEHRLPYYGQRVRVSDERPYAGRNIGDLVNPDLLAKETSKLLAEVNRIG